MTLQIQAAKYASEDNSLVVVQTPGGPVTLWSAHESWPDFVAWRDAGGEVLPAYTILSATYANPENTAAICETQESGAIAVAPERVHVWPLFETFRASNPVGDFVPPPEPEPEAPPA